MRFTPTSLVLAAAVVTAVGCNSKPPAVRDAEKNFDAYVSVKCPKEARNALARRLETKPENIRVAFYGPTGTGTNAYFAVMSRDGKALAGVYEEAWAKIINEHHETVFDERQYPWAVKCLRNDFPFSDRQVRFERTFPTRVTYGPTDVKVEFIDGWVEDKAEHNWSTGYVRVNLAGTILLDEKHGLDFIFTPHTGKE